MHSVSVVLQSGVPLGALLLIAALGELVAERAGTLNISVEAMMLFGAYAGGASALAAHSVLAGLATGTAAGLLVGLLQANLSHRVRIDQFVVGLVLVILVQGVTSFLIDSTQLSVVPVAGTWRIPGLHSIPIVGAALFGEPWPFYAVYLLIPLTYIVLYRSRWGLEVRSVGEDPASSRITGLRVNRRRRQAVCFCGVLGGYAGAMLAVAIVGGVSDDMTAGMGYISIAAVLLGGWSVGGTIFACTLFGVVEGLSLALPSLGVQANSELLVVAPYVAVLLAAPLVAWRRRQPGALGIGFEGA
jgi:simple sugar transport system permease protein